MAISNRFKPAQCPACGSPVEAPYAHYRNARQHFLFYPVLALGAGSTIGAVLLSLWGTGKLVATLVEGQELRRMERGLLFCVAFGVALSVIAWLFRLGWRFIHRLPRKFPYQCQSCQWSGEIQVIDTSDPIDLGNALPAVERVEFDGIPAPFDPIDARQERRQQRAERERRQAREQEHESPPNPDFDFRDP
jgi:hypothetical protein